MNDRFARWCGNVIAGAAVAFVLFFIVVASIAIARALL